MIDCLFYFMVFGIVFVINVYAIKQQKIPIKEFLIALGFLILLFFIGFRYNVGTDYPHYLDSYNDITGLSWNNIPSLRMELLPAVIFKLCSFMLLDARLIFVVLGLFMLWPIYKTNKLYDYKYLPYSVLVYCILFLPFGLNGIRQGVAMSYILLSITYLIKGNLKHSILNFVVAVLFHTSSFIALPYMVIVFFRKKYNYTLVNALLTMAISALVLFFLNDFLISQGFDQYSYVLSTIDANSVSMNSIATYLPIILMILLLGHTDEAFREDRSIYKNLTLSGIFFCLIGTAAQYLSRFGLYFMMPSILLLPMLIQEIPKKNTRVFVKLLFIIYLIVFFYVQYSLLGKHEILPYQTWLFGGL